MIQFRRSKNSACSIKNGLEPFLVVMVVLGSFIMGTQSRASDVNWNKDFSDSLKQAQKSNKYVLADVYTDWCGWCKRLDKDTFSNENMVRFLNDKFVCVKVNAEDKGEGSKVAGTYNVNGYPCALVFDSQGKLKGRVSGYRDATRYQEALSQIMSGKSSGDNE